MLRPYAYSLTWTWNLFTFSCDKFTVIRCISTKAIFQTFFHKIVVYRKTDSFRRTGTWKLLFKYYPLFSRYHAIFCKNIIELCEYFVCLLFFSRQKYKDREFFPFPANDKKCNLNQKKCDLYSCTNSVVISEELPARIEINCMWLRRSKS